MIRNLSFPLLAFGLLALVTVFVLSPVATAQSTASSLNYFVLCPEHANGGLSASTNFKMESAVGEGVVGKFAFSTNYKLLGGVNACADTPVAGSPWLSGTAPFYGPLLGGTSHTVHGHNLDLGVSTSATVGGFAAAVTTTAKDRLVIKLPAQSSPGYKPITATNSGGTAHLSPKGIGVLPLIELDWAIDIGQPWKFTYRGTQGDILYLAVTAAKLPGPVPIGPYHHGFELNLGAFIGLIGPLPVTAADGTMTLNFPGFFFFRPIYVQALALPSVPAGYNPGSFTNTIAL